MSRDLRDGDSGQWGRWRTDSRRSRSIQNSATTWIGTIYICWFLILAYACRQVEKCFWLVLKVWTISNLEKFEKSIWFVWLTKSIDCSVRSVRFCFVLALKKLLFYTVVYAAHLYFIRTSSTHPVQGIVQYTSLTVFLIEVFVSSFHWPLYFCRFCWLGWRSEGRVTQSWPEALLWQPVILLRPTVVIFQLSGNVSVAKTVLVHNFTRHVVSLNVFVINQDCK